MTLPEKEPCLTPVLSSSSSSMLFLGQSKSFEVNLESCKTAVRIRIFSLCAPTTHIHKEDLIRWKSVFGCPLSQERPETNKGLSHTCPRITLPSWWGLMYTAAGGTSTDPTIPFRSHSRPRSSLTQSRAPPLSPDPSPQDWEDRESWCSMLDVLGPLKHYWGWTPHWQYKKEYLVRG